MGLTRCYKTEGFFYIYYVKWSKITVTDYPRSGVVCNFDLVCLPVCLSVWMSVRCEL